MFKYRTLIILLGTLFFFPAVSNALSLGEIEIKSDFAQPFFAEISIPSYTSDELESLEVKLASAEKFETLGLELYPFMEDFVFQIEAKPNGTPFIKVFTKNPIKELSISFVIEVTWLGGKILKDFHILLTPEAITELREEQLMHKQLAQIESAPVAEQQTEIAIKEPAPAKLDASPITMAEAPVPTAEPEPAPAEVKQSPSERRDSRIKKFGAEGIQYTRVGRGESLSQIAMKLKPEDASLNQVMVALYEQNSQAFVDNNINKLKAGSTLTVEDVNDFKKNSRRDAMVLAQKYLDNSQIQAEPEQTIAAAEPETPAATEDKGNRLEISSTSEEPVPAEIMEKLKQEQIASTEEELKFARNAVSEIQAENQELKERIAALESQMELMSTLLQAAGPVPESAPHDESSSQQTDNLMVTSAELAPSENESLSLMERFKKYQTAISISSLSLLSLALVLIRKKDQIKEALAMRKEKPVKKVKQDLA